MRGLGWTLLVAVVLSACGGPQANRPPPASPVLPPPEAPKPQTVAPPAIPRHGHGRSPVVLRDGRGGETLSRDAILSRLRESRAIYVGEHHDNRASHQAQLAVLGSVYAIDHEMAMAVEMLPRRLQPQIDAYLAGALDEEGFLAAVDWEHTWGFDYGFYRPMFDFCRIHGLRLFALNAPRELPRAVRQRGLEGLSPEEQAQLPDGQPWPAPELHRRYIRQIFDGHPAAPGTDPAAREAAFERFYAAQLVWDETMAEAVAEILAAPAAPRRLVVLAGVGHVGPLAIPGRAARRGAGPSLTVAPIDKATDPPPTGAEAADVLVVLGEDNK